MQWTGCNSNFFFLLYELDDRSNTGDDRRYGGFAGGRKGYNERAGVSNDDDDD